jgi:hypothetical protein
MFQPLLAEQHKNINKNAYSCSRAYILNRQKGDDQF